MNTKLRVVQEMAVSTDPELPNDIDMEVCRVHQMLATLINQKFISIKDDICDAKLKWKVQPQLLVQRLSEKNTKNKQKLGRRKGRCMHSCRKHHHHHQHHHHQHRHNLDHRLFHHHHHHCDGIVRQEEPVRGEEWTNNQKLVPYLGGHILTAALQRSTAGMSEENRHYTESQNPKVRSKKKSRRTRFGEDKRNNIMRPPMVPTINPNDLPQRAKWTIIITAGLLLITCMLLVGVTLRMAPVIDEIVRNQNEELMNSLDREEFGPSENSTEEMYTSR